MKQNPETTHVATRLATIVMVLLAASLTASTVFAEETAAEGSEDAAATDAVADQDEDTDEDSQISASVEEEAVGGGDDGFPVSFSLGVSGNFGAATLLADTEYTQTDYFLMSTSLGARYKTPVEDLSVSAGLGYSKYLSNDGQVEQREGRLGDLRITGSYASIYNDEEYTGINLSGSLGFTFPTSQASRFQTLRTRVSPGISLSRSWGGLSLSYSLSGGIYFHEYTSPVGDVDELDIIARDGGTETLGEGLVALGGVLPQYSISNSFALSFAFLNDFSASLSLGYSDVWTYDNGTITEEDEFTAENAVVGRGHAQSVSGGVGLNYSINEYVSANAGVFTAGAPKTSDNKNYRFPFWDFENGQAARTSMSLGLSASY